MTPGFVSVPAGAFLMGSETGQEDERPVHRVHVDAFEMSIHPVTRGEYARFLAAAGAAGNGLPRDWGDPALSGDDRPVVGVSWHDAMAYCAWRTASGDPQRLPTEAEWERAARAGTEGAAFPCGETIPGWIPEGGRGPLAGPWPVTLGEPNAFGLYGIAANVHEWCADWHDRGYYAASPERNPRGPASGVRRASRGGSWRHAVTISRCAARSKIDPSFRYTDYGFRPVREGSSA
jgi:formylglycine-generating enzyme required for sulfatase activity